MPSTSGLRKKATLVALAGRGAVGGRGAAGRKMPGRSRRASPRGASSSAVPWRAAASAASGGSSRTRTRNPGAPSETRIASAIAAASGPDAWSDARSVSVGSIGPTWASRRRARAASKRDGPASRRCPRAGGKPPGVRRRPLTEGRTEESGVERERHRLADRLAAGEARDRLRSARSPSRHVGPETTWSPTAAHEGGAATSAAWRGPPGDSPGERGRIVRRPHAGSDGRSGARSPRQVGAVSSASRSGVSSTAR